ncbi:unnamed protein product [Gordionus sp. m RMFG-2023]
MVGNILLSTLIQQQQMQQQLLTNHILANNRNNPVISQNQANNILSSSLNQALIQPSNLDLLRTSSYQDTLQNYINGNQVVANQYNLPTSQSSNLAYAIG